MNTRAACNDVRDLMLEADVADLRGAGESMVARHIRECSECARYANRILESYGIINAGLDSIRTTRPGVVPIHQRRFRWLPVPIAAAAVIALVMVTRQREVVPNVDALAQLMMEQAPIATPRAGEQALVMEKDEMTIVWLYKQEIR